MAFSVVAVIGTEGQQHQSAKPGSLSFSLLNSISLFECSITSLPILLLMHIWTELFGNTNGAATNSLIYGS